MKYPARPSRLAAKKNPKKKLNFGKWVLLTIGLLLIVLVLYIIFGPHIWDSKSRISIALQSKNGNVSVVTLDPGSSTITTIEIPGSTQVSASRDLGTWKLESIERLGVNEKIDGGNFLASTITKSFKFPIEGWGSDGMVNLTLPSLLRQTKTNLHIKDKIAIAIFSFGVKSSSKVNIKLEDTGYITPAKLPDGSKGYEISQNIPVKVASVFTDTQISKREVNVVIVDKMPDDYISAKVGEIIEVLGAKVASIDKKDSDNSDCVVKGLDPSVHKIANLFRCKEVSQKLDSMADVEVDLGSSFKKRF